MKEGQCKKKKAICEGKRVQFNSRVRVQSNMFGALLLKKI
jgi:hypothetical protein